MMVEGREPSRKARIAPATCSLGSPASETPSCVALRPSVPWQLAQVAARLRAAGLSCAWAGSAAKASAMATACFIARVLGDGRGFLFERELELLVLADVDGHLAAVLQAAEEELVGERAADRVLDEPRHRPRAHQRIEAFLRQVLLQR